MFNNVYIHESHESVQMCSRVLVHWKCISFPSGSGSVDVRATEEEKEGKQKLSAGPEDSVEEKGGRRGGPKKLFKWSDEIRSETSKSVRLFDMVSYYALCREIYMRNISSPAGSASVIC